MTIEFLLSEIRRLENRLEQLESIDSIPIVARASRDFDQSIPNATFTPINFNVTEIDTRTAVTTTPNWRFVAPVGGWYHVTAGIRYEAHVGWGLGINALISVHVNGTVVKYVEIDASTPSGGSPGLGNGVDVEVSKNDYIEVNTYQDTGFAVNLLGSTLWNYVSLFKIRGY